MRKIYTIQLNNGNLHKNNLGEIVYFHTKQDVRNYMRYNHYEGTIQYFDIDINKDKKITDLEAKLAETQRAYREYREAVEKDIKKEIDERMRDTIKEFDLDISQLKQQLAEKEKLLKKYVATSCPINQDKIELLEKVLDYFCEEDEDGDGIKTGDWTITKDACEVAEYIDTLIKEIKGE